jgi:Domain of unknown function (DUF4105)
MVLLALLGACAIHYSTVQPEWLLALITAIFLAIAGFAIFALPFRVSVIIWAAVMSGTLAWYIQDPPSNNRDWATEYAIPATVSYNGQTITIHNIRDFAYRSETDMTPHYYDAAFRLDALDTVDLVSSYWSGDAIAHIFLTFGFQDGRHLAISIETRRQKRFPYSTIAGFFHHFELFYAVADERDLIGLRTDIRHERVYLYRLRITAAARQALFLSYVNQIDKLSKNPEWYNTLTDNCTTGILARAEAPQDIRYNWRIVLSGYAPEYAYEHGLLNTSQNFANLKQQSLIVRPSGATITNSYSRDIRKNLPLKVSNPAG